jgi:hypothetical protein
MDDVPAEVYEPPVPWGRVDDSWERPDEIQVVSAVVPAPVSATVPVNPQAPVPSPSMQGRRRQLASPAGLDDAGRPANVTALRTQPSSEGWESDVPASVTPLPTRNYVQSRSARAGSGATDAAAEVPTDLTLARAPGAVAEDKPIDSKYTVRAFRVLPTLWQHVLWMTSVEGCTTAQAAARLELSRGVTAAAVLHAREGLRHEWLSALLNERDLAISCSSVIQFMHAYACDVATSAETELIEQHLHRCGRCTTITDEFARLPERLSVVLSPLAEAGVDVFSAGPESVENVSSGKATAVPRSGGRHMA